MRKKYFQLCSLIVSSGGMYAQTNDMSNIKEDSFNSAPQGQLKKCVLGNTPIPHRPRIPRIDKYLDLCLNCTRFVKNLTDSHSP